MFYNRIKQWLADFTNPPIVGVDIGSTLIKLAEVTLSNGQIILSRFAIEPILDKDPVFSLKRALTKGGFQTNYAALGLASPKVVLQSFQFPPMSKKELAGAVHLEAERAAVYGYAINELSIDWQEIPVPLPKVPGSPFQSENEPGTFGRGTASNNSTQGLLAVAPKTDIAARIEIAKQAGLIPLIADVEGLALWNAYWALSGSKESGSKTILLVNIGAHVTNFVIGRTPNQLFLSRDIEVGKDFLSSGGGDDWLSEIKDSLTYARSKNGLRELDAIYLTGGGSSPEVCSLLKSAIGVPVTLWNPLEQIAFQLQIPIDRSVGSVLAVAIGLALRRSE